MTKEQFILELKPLQEPLRRFLLGLCGGDSFTAAEIKRLHDEAIRRYRLIALITLIAGIVVGGLLIALILLHPVSAPQLDSELFARILAFAAEWKYVGFLLIASVAIILGLKPLSASGNSRSTRPF